MSEKLKVLLVDDQPGYRRRAVDALSSQGCDVRTAADGREAIALGSGYRPDVIVSAWMLEGRLHGIHVAEALRALRPETRTVLLTESATTLPPVEMAESDVSALIDRPPRPERLMDVIRLAAASRDAVQPAPTPAIAHFSPDGELLYANPSAVDLVEHCGGSSALWQAFSKQSDADPGAPAESDSRGSAAREWTALASSVTGTALGADVHARVRVLDDGSCLVAFAGAADLAAARAHPALGLLMGGAGAPGCHFRFEGLGVMIDSERSYRELGCRVFHALGGSCFPANDADSAIEILATVDGVRHVIVDYEAPGDVGGFVETVRREWPEICLIGQSRFDRRASFEDVGVSKFIAKPWRLLELVAELTSEVGH
jgi:DNA-binding NtrC family response regulator